MPDKGPKLNERVWRLFAEAGFHTNPNSDSPDEYQVRLPGVRKTRPVDLRAEVPELNVTIIGENKSRKDFPRSVTAFLSDLKARAEAADANKALFVSAEKEISQEDKDFAAVNNIIVWESSDLKYYEEIVSAIGPYAKYEILSAMGISTVEQTFTHNILTIKFLQPFSHSGVNMYIFTAHPEFLLKTCAVLRRARGDARAYQRILRQERLSKILKFVTLSDSLLPPNIVVHLSDDVNYSPIEFPTKDNHNRSVNLTDRLSYELGVLAVPAKYASLEIIDGQHRLYGFHKAEPATKGSYNLAVLAIQGLTEKRRKETFIAINDKARRVDPNLVAYLKHTENEVECQKDPELMAIRLAVLLNQNAPLKGRIRLVDIGNAPITLKGFCGYDLRSLVGPRGLLRTYRKLPCQVDNS
jgi:DGQHR domain-containing protein